PPSLSLVWTRFFPFCADIARRENYLLRKESGGWRENFKSGWLELFKFSKIQK
ncbi:hypothetical protein F444_03524, partial [Phytophthora nicotianae P1976]